MLFADFFVSALRRAALSRYCCAPSAISLAFWSVCFSASPRASSSRLVRSSGVKLAKSTAADSPLLLASSSALVEDEEEEVVGTNTSKSAARSKGRAC